ncbi:hypothetical protein DFH28DRAFT_1197995 [Melampsora americana]|nr:hypothetical protein DFH28DRAFT_1197995 [Melampsora americana]
MAEGDLEKFRVEQSFSSPAIQLTNRFPDLLRRSRFCFLRIVSEYLGGHRWRRVVKKCEEEEGGRLEVRILRICPWYKELEPVLRDRPLASPLASRDSLGSCDQQSTSIAQRSPTDSTGQSNKPSRSVTPSVPPSKRFRSNSKEIPLAIGTKELPRDSLDFASILGCIPTKEDREESETRVARTQETISSNFAKEMSHMMTTNRAAELASKENIAISKMNVELRIARSKMVVDLIRGNVDPTVAEAVALRSLPDIMPGQSARHLSDAQDSGTSSQSHATPSD